MSTAHGLGAAEAAADSVVGVDAYSHDSTAAAVARLATLVEAQARVIRNHEAALARSRQLSHRPQCKPPGAGS